MRKTRLKSLRAEYRAAHAGNAPLKSTMRVLKGNWTRGLPLDAIRTHTALRTRGWLKEQDRERRTAWKQALRAQRLKQRVSRIVSMGGGGE